MKIKPVEKINDGRIQTFEEKLEVLRLKLNEIVEWINEKNTNK